MEYKTCRGIVVKSDDRQGIIDAVFAVHGVQDLQNDIGHPGMFKRTFTERGHKVKVLDNHQAASVLNVIGKPLALRELSRDELPHTIKAEQPQATGGALASIQMLMDTPEGRGAYIRLAQSAISEWSYGFDVTEHDYSEVRKNGKKVMVRNLRAATLYEISPVIWAAQPSTMTTNVKTRQRSDLDLLIELEQEWERLDYGRTRSELLAEILIEQAIIAHLR